MNSVQFAKAMYRKAAEQGDAQSQLILGSMFEEGLGVPKNLGESAVWYRKAAEQGSQAARKRLDELNSSRGN